MGRGDGMAWDNLTCACIVYSIHTCTPFYEPPWMGVNTRLKGMCGTSLVADWRNNTRIEYFR